MKHIMRFFLKQEQDYKERGVTNALVLWNYLHTTDFEISFITFPAMSVLLV